MRRPILLLLFLSACGDDAPAPPPPTAPLASPDDVPSQVRVAHLSPDAGPVDFCFASDAGTLGPVLEEAGLAGGVAFGDVTPYLPADAGTFTVQVIGADATNCTAPLIEVPNVVVPPGGLEITTAAIGLTQGDPSFEFIFLLDENTPSEDGGKVRFVHASPGLGDVDAGLLAGDEVLDEGAVTWSGVAYGATDQPPYAILAPGGGMVRAQLTDDPDTGVVTMVGVAAGQVATVFAVGLPGELQLVVCVDNEGDGSCRRQP